MGLTVTMCHDIEKYEESEMGGLGVKKILAIALGIISGAVCMSVLYFILHIPLMISVYLMLPVVIFVISRGFYGKGKMSLLQGILSFRRAEQKPLTYQSTENVKMEVRTEKKEETNGKEKKRGRMFSLHLRRG